MTPSRERVAWSLPATTRRRVDVLDVDAACAIAKLVWFDPVSAPAVNR
jgi:hypothetical protein